MKVLDSDTLTLLLGGQPLVRARQQQETEELAVTIISRIEALQSPSPTDPRW